MAERRRSPRLNAHIPLRCEQRPSGRFNFTLTKDIAEEGIRFISENFVAPQTELMLEFSLAPNSKASIRAHCRVIWSARAHATDRYNVGARFIEMEPEAKEGIAQYIEANYIPPSGR